MTTVRNAAFGLAMIAGIAGGGAFAPAASAQSACDPAYLNFCIPPAYAVGDLDCPDLCAQGISWIPVATIGVDPHGFDADLDGYGCEG